MAFIAADQYHSSSSFSVRSIDSAQPSDILGMFSQAGAGSTLSDSYVLIDFIRSERMVQAIDEAFGLDSVFAPRGADYFYGIGRDLPIEDKLEYWRRMVSINFDHTSGIMELEVKAFTPEDSQKIAAFIIAQSERLINDLSLSARDSRPQVVGERSAHADLFGMVIAPLLIKQCDGSKVFWNRTNRVNSGQSASPCMR